MPMPIPSSSRGKAGGARRAAAAALCTLLRAGGAHAAEHRIACPPTLPPAALQVAAPPAGWTAFVPAGLRLRSAGPMDGPPSDMVILREDSYVTRGGRVTAIWRHLRDMPMPAGKWMACNYGAGNDVILSQRLDDATSACTVTYTKNARDSDDIDVRCEW